MEQYYNHLTDRLEDLEPFMARTLPRSREEYVRRLLDKELEKPKYNVKPEERESATESLRKFSENVHVTLDKHPSGNPFYLAAKEYLKDHPEEVIKLRDEGLVEELLAFADKDNTGVVQDAPTEEEVYIAKKEAEGFTLDRVGEFGTYFVKQEEGALDKAFNQMSDEEQANLVESIKTAMEPLREHPCNKHIEPSRYMMGNDPYGDALTKPYIAKKNEDGSVQYLRNPEDILEDRDEVFESSIQEVSKYILLAITIIVLCIIIYLGLK
jgi:hypothetical protein